MVESVLRLFIEKGLVKGLNIMETPSLKRRRSSGVNGQRDVWILSIILTDGTNDTLESARGGAREWASLDRLVHWLRRQGLDSYSISLTISHEAGRQKSLNFAL